MTRRKMEAPDGDTVVVLGPSRPIVHREFVRTVEQVCEERRLRLVRAVSAGSELESEIGQSTALQIMFVSSSRELHWRGSAVGFLTQGHRHLIVCCRDDAADDCFEFARSHSAHDRIVEAFSHPKEITDGVCVRFRSVVSHVLLRISSDSSFLQTDESFDGLPPEGDGAVGVPPSNIPILQVLKSLSWKQFSSCFLVVLGTVTTCFSLGNWCANMKGERSCAELQALLSEAKGQKVELQNRVSTLEAESSTVNITQRLTVEENGRLVAELKRREEKESMEALVRRLLLTLVFLQQRASTLAPEDIGMYREDVFRIACQLEENGKASLGVDPESGEMTVRLGENGELLRLGRKTQESMAPDE